MIGSEKLDHGATLDDGELFQQLLMGLQATQA